MIISLTNFLKKIDKNTLNTAVEHAFQLSKIHNIKIEIKDIDVDKANYSTLLDCVDKKELTALILQVLEQASKKFLSIKIDNSIDAFLKKAFAENDKSLRKLISNYYDEHKTKDINDLNDDEINDENKVILTSSFTYFIIYNDRIIQKKNEGDINEIITDNDIKDFVKGKYFSSGIYLVEQESNMDAVEVIKQQDSQCKKIYKINNSRGEELTIERLAKKIN